MRSQAELILLDGAGMGEVVTSEVQKCRSSKVPKFRSAEVQKLNKGEF